MIIITSDMHLADQTLAPRISRKALDRFVEIVREEARKNGPTEVVFLGDIFDVLRSRRWLAEDWHLNGKWEPVHVRPWSSIDQEPLTLVLRSILHDIKICYGGFFRDLKNCGDVKLTWVPGNHDRLVGCTRLGRRWIEDLGLDYREDLEVVRPNHRVLAKHGHVHDALNSWKGDPKVSPFGDYVMVEVVDQFQFEAMKIRNVTDADDSEISFLAAIEHVHPRMSVPVWVWRQTRVLKDPTLTGLIREAWKNSATAAKLSFPALGGTVGWPVRYFFAMLLSAASRGNDMLAVKWLCGLPFLLFSLAEKWLDTSSDLTRYALKDACLSDREIRSVIYGHTHKAAKGIPIGAGKFYYNTAWWERSWKKDGSNRQPITEAFTLLLVAGPESKPVYHREGIQAPDEWEPPYKEEITPGEAVTKSLEADNPWERNELVSRGVLSMFRKAPATENMRRPTQSENIQTEKVIKIEIGPVSMRAQDAPPGGFELIVDHHMGRENRPTTSGVQFAGHVDEEYVNFMNRVTTAAGTENCFVFTPSRISPELEQKAAEKGVYVFDEQALEALHTPGDFQRSIEERLRG